MTEVHWFTQPTATDPGTLNPVFEVLDYPIVMGGADDIVLTGETPEAPLIDGREVTDPRLLTALSAPVELDRAEVLDRSAKLGGILRAMGIDPGSARLRIASDVPALARALSVLAALRIGMLVDDRAEAAAGEVAEVAAGEGAEVAAGDGTGIVVRIHAIDAPSAEPGRASVKVVRSRFEGVGLTVAGQTANLDQAMRDSRVESAEVVPLPPDRTVVLTDDGALEAGNGVTWLQETVLDTR